MAAEDMAELLDMATPRHTEDVVLLERMRTRLAGRPPSDGKWREQEARKGREQSGMAALAGCSARTADRALKAMQRWPDVAAALDSGELTPFAAERINNQRMSVAMTEYRRIVRECIGVADMTEDKVAEVWAEASAHAIEGVPATRDSFETWVSNDRIVLPSTIESYSMSPNGDTHATDAVPTSGPTTDGNGRGRR